MRNFGFRDPTDGLPTSLVYANTPINYVFQVGVVKTNNGMHIWDFIALIFGTFIVTFSK